MISTPPNGSFIILLEDGKFNRFVPADSGSIQFFKFLSAALISAVTIPSSVTQLSSGLFFRFSFNASYNSCSLSSMACFNFFNCSFLNAKDLVAPLSKYLRNLPNFQHAMYDLCFWMKGPVGACDSPMSILFIVGTPDNFLRAYSNTMPRHTSGRVQLLHIM